MNDMDLPQGWEKCHLPNFSDIVMGQSPPSETYNTKGIGLPFFQGKAEFGELSPTVAKYCDTPGKIANKGATLLCVRAPVGPTNIAIEKCCIGRGLAAIHPLDSISPMFILYLMRSAEPNISTEGTGSTFTAINRQFIEELEFGLPPLAEQHRIVAKIEELFSELDKGIENLKTAREQLKVYRQALLKHAFEGKLTVQWREERRANSAHTVIPAQAEIHADQKLDHRLRGGDELCGLDDKPLETAAALLARIQTEREQRYQQQLKQWQTTGGSKPKALKPLPPLTAEELAELPELPEGWGWVKLGELTWSVKDGPHFSPKYVEKGIPFISGGNIRPDGVDFDKAKHISRELHEELSKRCKPEIGDVLYTKGGTTGIARVNTFSVDFNVWVHVAVLKLTSVVKPFYLQHALNSSFCYSQSQKYTHGVGNQDLGLTRMVNIVLAICSIEEQEEVIRIVDDKMSVIDQLELTITTSLQQAEALRQSILKKAFSGQLVAQDANDEPAAALLARIRAEKTQHTEKPKQPMSRSKCNQ